MIIIKIVNKYNLCNIIFGFIYFYFGWRWVYSVMQFIAHERKHDAWQTNEQNTQTLCL